MSEIDALNMRLARKAEQCADLESQRDMLRMALEELIRVWEGPRERAAVGFAAAIVNARKALGK